MTRSKKNPTHFAGIACEQLDELIEEALVDAHDELEQTSGFCCALQDNVQFPFATTVLGARVSVTDVDVDRMGESVVAKVRRGKHEQTLPLADLPLPKQLPDGGEWIVAYQYWTRATTGSLGEARDAEAPEDDGES